MRLVLGIVVVLVLCSLVQCQSIEVIFSRTVPANESYDIYGLYTYDGQTFLAFMGSFTKKLVVFNNNFDQVATPFSYGFDISGYPSTLFINSSVALVTVVSTMKQPYCIVINAIDGSFAMNPIGTIGNASQFALLDLQTGSGSSVGVFYSDPTYTTQFVCIMDFSTFTISAPLLKLSTTCEIQYALEDPLNPLGYGIVICVEYSSSSASATWLGYNISSGAVILSVKTSDYLSYVDSASPGVLTWQDGTFVFYYNYITKHSTGSPLPGASISFVLSNGEGLNFIVPVMGNELEAWVMEYDPVEQSSSVVAGNTSLGAYNIDYGIAVSGTSFYFTASTSQFINGTFIDNYYFVELGFSAQ